MKRIAISLWFIAALSCVSPHGVVTADTDPTGWYEDSPVTVEFENGDTLCTYDVRFMIRFVRSVSAGQLVFDVERIAADSVYPIDRMRLTAAIPPDAVADFFESTVPYRRGLRLPNKGKYVFHVTPVAPVYGVTAVGLDFRKNGQE